MISEQECRNQHQAILTKLTTIDANQQTQKEESKQHSKDINDLYDKYNELNIKVSDNSAAFYKMLVDKVDSMKNELMKTIEDKLDKRSDKWFRVIEIVVMASSIVAMIWIATLQKG